MSEQIIQGDEDPAVAAARKAAWLADAPNRIPENTPTTLADIARALMTPGVTLPLTVAQIAAAKRNRP